MDVNCPKGGRHQIELYWRDGHPYRCHNCHKVMAMQTVGALANAAMQLTAEEAQEIINGFEDVDYDETVPLAAYAEAWPK